MSSGGDNVEEKSTSDVAHVVTDESESRLSRGDHSRDDSMEYVGACIPYVYASKRRSL